MRTRPEDLDDDEVVGALRRGWRLRVLRAEYVPVGGGSHHWLAHDDAGGRHWVTVDDLARKAFLGGTRRAAFDGLRRAFDTALALREGGLEFVVAPVPTPAGETVRRLGARYSVAVFPFVDGPAGRFGEPLAAAARVGLVDTIVRLHRAAPPAAAGPWPSSLRLAQRGDLERALRSPAREWAGGPFSEPARALVAGHAAGIRHLLETFDRLADRVVASGATPVVTHGEPHPANVVDAGGRLHLVDWDTVALAPPERDLWMIDAGAGDELARYAEASGRRIDAAAVRLYRLRWLLDDVASFVNALRSAHRRTADTEHAWRSLVHYVESEDLSRLARR